MIRFKRCERRGSSPELSRGSTSAGAVGSSKTDARLSAVDCPRGGQPSSSGDEIDERGKFLRHAAGDGTDHHTAIGMADQNDIGQILVVDNSDHVLNMRVRLISWLRRCLRSPIPVRVGAYTSCPASRSLCDNCRQPPGRPRSRAPGRTSPQLPLLITRHVFEQCLGLKRQCHCYQRWHLGGKIRLDRAPEVGVAPRARRKRRLTRRWRNTDSNSRPRSSARSVCRETPREASHMVGTVWTALRDNLVTPNVAGTSADPGTRADQHAGGVAAPCRDGSA